jgi:tetratricopeptide (TPR) repeat protein
MISKEQLATLTEVLATASVVGIGWALGGTVGAAVMAGIGINLSSDIIQQGSTHLKEKWISAKYGVLNHDIQRALARAFVKALASLEARYFELPEANGHPTEKKEAIRGLFKELKDEAPTVFAASVENIVSGQEIKEYLYGEPVAARAKLWERVQGTKLLYTYYGEPFKEFLRDNLNDELVFWFGEELKADNRECNKAWRAFQRMLLEGIQADVKAVQASQEMIRQDLYVLDVIRTQLDELKDTIDRRVDGEPFQQGLEQALQSMKALLESIARTTERTEIKVDGVVATTERTEAKIDTVVAALSPKPESTIPKIPDDIQGLFDEGNVLRDEGKYEDARAAFTKALELAESYEHSLGTTTAKYYLSIILHEWDKNSVAAKALLYECLEVVKVIRSDKHIERVRHQLGVIELDEGNLDEAEAYFSQNLELDRKLNDKKGIAFTLHMLGWLEDHRGHFGKALELYDQALTYWLGIYRDGDSESVKEAVHSIAGEYQHKGLVHEHLGNVEEVESNYMRALEWHRKSDFKPDIGKILFLLARLKYREAHYDSGTAFLDEAIELYARIGDHSWRSRCLDLRARVHFTLGQTEEATRIFESALEAVEEAGDYKEQETYLNKLGRIYLEGQRAKEAKDYFERARDLSLDHGLLEAYATSVKNLAEIAHIEQNVAERNRLILEGIQTLERHLVSVQGEPQRAFIVGRIGFFYEGMEDFEQALVYYQKARKIFESLSDIGGLGNSLGSIARMKGLLGKLNEEFDTYRELKKTVEGTPYYDLIAGTDINLGVLQMRSGNLYEAKMLFQEAERLCRKYNLHYLPTLQENLERLDDRAKERKPPELDFRELLDELFAWVEWFPEAKNSILRLWLWARMEALVGNFRNAPGVKLVVCQDDLDIFLKTSQVFYPYADLCLQVVSSKYPSSGLDVIPFPMDKELFFDCAIPYTEEIGDGVYTMSFLSGSLQSRYTLTSGTKVRSKITGNEGVTITGWSSGLPDQAHQLILGNSADELISRKTFFLPGERYLAEDKLLPDLVHSRELGLIPVYFETLPESEKVEVVMSALINLPVLAKEAVPHLRTQLRAVKRTLVRLMDSGKDVAKIVLNELVLELEELTVDDKAAEQIRIEVYVLEFWDGLNKAGHVALVIPQHSLIS